jgi:hypothetical protein
VSYPTFKTHFKNGDSYQVMSQAIGQEPLLTTLHPLPAGSRIMGGQEKSQCHLGWGNPGQPPRWDCFRSMTGYPRPSHILRNIPLPLTKTWNTYSLGYCGSYLPQVHPMGLGTTLCRTCSAIFECCTGPPQQADRQGAGTKKDRRREERNEIKKEEFAVYDRVCHDQR